MLPLEVFVRELLSVDGLSTCPITSSEVTTLQHEILDDTMKDRSWRAVSNPVVTRENTNMYHGQPLYDKGFPDLPTPFSPVHNARKFFVVFGTTIA